MPPGELPRFQEAEISCESFEQWAYAKIAARERLLVMPPEEAQQLVNQTLFPQYWKFRPEDADWEETIPSCYGEIDP
jgi:hypothetical protein